jgi:hypothetical protein
VNVLSAKVYLSSLTMMYVHDRVSQQRSDMTDFLHHFKVEMSICNEPDFKESVFEKRIHATIHSNQLLHMDDFQHVNLTRSRYKLNWVFYMVARSYIFIPKNQILVFLKGLGMEK